MELYGVMSAIRPIGSAGRWRLVTSREAFSNGWPQPRMNRTPSFMNASLDQPAVLDFFRDGADDAYRIKRNTGHLGMIPIILTEYIYIGEVGRFQIEREGYHELQWPGTNSMITSADVDYMLQLGGWFMDREGKQMISFADYQPPDSNENIELILFTSIDEDGFGKVHTILEDSGQELPDGTAVAATPASSSLELEKGGKLWPVYFSEIWDVVNEEWQPQYFYYEDGFVLIPENGMEGVEVEFAQETEGEYSLELQASDFIGNFSEILEYNITVPAEKIGDPVDDYGYVSTLEFTGLPPLYTIG